MQKRGPWMETREADPIGLQLDPRGSQELEKAMVLSLH